jgi:hypothetical protein
MANVHLGMDRILFSEKAFFIAAFFTLRLRAWQ